jgi:hypothetical protein
MSFPVSYSEATLRGIFTKLINTMLPRVSATGALGLSTTAVQTYMDHLGLPTTLQALTLLTERPVFGGNRLEFFRFATIRKRSKTAANCDSSFYRWEKFGPHRLARRDHSDEPRTRRARH